MNSLVKDKLTAHTVLRRAPNLTIKIGTDNQLSVFWQGSRAEFGPRALSVLDVFSQARRLDKAFELLHSVARGAQDWIDLTGCVIELFHHGILQDDENPILIPKSPGYDAPGMHILMLNDRVRTTGFLEAIKKTVRPGDIVLDVGTGTGILAMAAARAGASHVYAIEATSIGRTAKLNFEANGLKDQITLIEGWSTQIDLADRADVLVSEMIGDEALAERVLEVTLDARKRLLKLGARFVPAKIRLFGMPVTVPPERLNRSMFTNEVVSKWKSWYGLDFGRMVEVSRKYPSHFLVGPGEASSWKMLGEPVMLGEFEMSSFSNTAIETTLEATINDSGVFNAFLYFFEAELSSGNCLSTNPAAVSTDSHWRHFVQILTPQFAVGCGDRFQVKFTYRANEIGASSVDFRMLGQRGAPIE